MPLKRSPAREQCKQIIHKALAVVLPQFRLNVRHGVHGVPHWSRVWYHGWKMAQASDVNPAILAWFAYLHDSQRENDHRDPQHGARAVDFAVYLKHEGILTELSRNELEYLCEAMRLHSDGVTQGHPALQACWDADRLDLWRVGIQPQLRYLSTPYARKPSTQKRANQLAEASWSTSA